MISFGNFNVKFLNLPVKALLLSRTFLTVYVYSRRDIPGVRFLLPTKNTELFLVKKIESKSPGSSCRKRSLFMTTS